MNKLESEQLKNLLLRMHKRGYDGASFDELMAEMQKYLLQMVKDA